ncbi:MAG: PASTA domain-containing protein [Endomicrobia bacterium]|nr:PASTA domain-containing protein [Endomicrobiia bacterium]
MKTLIKLLVALIVIAGAAYYSLNMVMTAVVHSKKEAALPDVKGKSIADALDTLSAAGFGMKKEGEEFNQNVAPGVVLRQSPPAGMSVKEGKVVKVTISRGSEMIYVPDLVGQTVRAADIALKSVKLMMGEISRQYSATAEKGMVLSQDPAAGTAADKDAVVNLVISDGPQPAGAAQADSARSDK